MDQDESRNQKALQPSENSRRSGTVNAEFDQFWARLCAAFPRTEATLATTALYYERLRRFKPEHLRRAADILIDNCEYFPTIAEIIATIQRLPKPKPAVLIEERPDPEKVAEARRQLAELIDAKSVKQKA